MQGLPRLKDKLDYVAFQSFEPINSAPENSTIIANVLDVFHDLECEIGRVYHTLAPSSISSTITFNAILVAPSRTVRVQIPLRDPHWKICPA